MTESYEWDEFRFLVEDRFAKALKMDLQDAPFPLCGHEASLWLRCKRETLQWVSEMRYYVAAATTKPTVAPAHRGGARE